MTPAEKYRTAYTKAEVALLKRLREGDSPLPWAEIQAVHFPMRTVDALKMKFRQEWPSGNGRGRPPRKTIEAHGGVSDFNKMVRKGTAALGRAIDKVFGQGIAA